MQSSKEELAAMITDAKQMGKRIRSIDNLIGQVDNPELKQQYANELLKLVEVYKKLIDGLEAELRAHIKHEIDEGLPRTFEYHRILRMLKA